MLLLSGVRINVGEEVPLALLRSNCRAARCLAILDKIHPADVSDRAWVDMKDSVKYDLIEEATRAIDTEVPK